MDSTEYALEEWGDDVYVIPQLWDLDTCDELLAQIGEMSFEEAPVGRHKMRSVRNNDRIIWDNQPMATRLWHQLCRYPLPRFFGKEPIGMNERFRIYRYREGQQFEWHADGRFRRENGEQSLYTFLLYLTEDMSGGETLFRDAKVTPRKGLACLFGHKREHKGAEVTSGEKIVLRSDLMYPRLPLR